MVRIYWQLVRFPLKDELKLLLEIIVGKWVGKSLITSTLMRMYVW